jgi:hypothetical protein
MAGRARSRYRNPMTSAAGMSGILEQMDGAHVTAGLVDPLAANIDRVAFQHGRAHSVRVPDRAIQHQVHKPAATEPRPHHEADHRPCALVLDMRDRLGVDQGAVGRPRRGRAPAGDLAINVRQNPRTWFALGQRDLTGRPVGTGL